MHVERARRPGVVVAVCVVLSIASLAIPATLAYDPWAWLVWGREAAALSLDTTRGPSWKPLPVLVTSVLSVTGGLAPTVWLVLTRTAGLLAVVAAYRLAARFAGRVAGAVAAVLLLVAPDGDPRYPRLVLEGHTAPLTAALLLWAIDRHLEGRRATALLLGVVLALDRPEAWPFLGVYAVWLWRNDPRLRRLLCISLPVVPLLWFGGDWWGAGSPWHGADAAQVVANDRNRLSDALVRVADVVAAPAWILAGFAAFDARRRREAGVLGIAVIAVAWFAIVVAMSALFGYAALTRFLLPGAALVCVLAGIGVVRMFEAVTTTRARVAVVLVLVLVASPFVVVRAVGVGDVVAEMTERRRVVDGLDDAIRRAGGTDAVAACGWVAIDDLGVPRLALAWELDLPIADVRRPPRGRGGVLFATAGKRAARRAAEAGATVLASTRYWVVFDGDCERAPRS